MSVSVIPVLLSRVWLGTLFILTILFAAFSTLNAEAVNPRSYSKESEALPTVNTGGAVRDRSKSFSGQRAQASTVKLNPYLFWAARLPWSPNAPGD
jgi:hypothetical protein